eukprot:CAMPEP_0115399448 /NCGR_PEP_ID=MMETSP0271-20121206/14842_1 /TAXON_ID=71861 /ORGANISM="Scrippsiella trochoidea, Strain CCMP3099" /LENGTH=723 /DNA_ID=CAMNT_0002823261 /DNA_START=170 /DNA_END=2337 /DNA_ORIENTATION=+
MSEASAVVSSPPTSPVAGQGAERGSGRFGRLLDQLAEEHEALRAENRRLASIVNNSDDLSPHHGSKDDSPRHVKDPFRESGSREDDSPRPNSKDSFDKLGARNSLSSSTSNGSVYTLYDEWKRSCEGEEIKRQLPICSVPTKQFSAQSLVAPDALRAGDAIQSEGCSRHLVTKPGSRSRIKWDLMSVLIITYDAMVIPMQAFPMPESDFSSTMAWVTTCFWTADMAGNFLAGYQVNGMVELRLSKIAGRYLRTWFPCDLLLVLLDWVIMLSVGGGGSGDAIGIFRITKSLRVIRILRMLRLVRLVRLIKVISLIAEFSDYVRSENMLTVIGILKLLIALIVVNHFIACAWYSLGDLDADSTWTTKLKSDLLEEEGREPDVGYMYFTSLHWSLTQFTPASMEVFPCNEFERIFNIFVLIFAMVVFSSFVSSITNSVSVMRVRNEQRSIQEEHVRRYLTERKVSLDLGNRIYHFLRQHRYKAHRRVQEEDVPIFATLPEQLLVQLRVEVYEPIILPHPLFERLRSVDWVCVTKICHLAISDRFVCAEQDLFGAGERALSAMTVTSGEMTYYKDREANSVSLRLKVSTGFWVSEAALWVHWRHLGTLSANSDCELLAINAKAFRNVLVDRPCLEGFRVYAQRFADRLSEDSKSGVTRGADIQEVHDLISDEEVEVMFADFMPEEDDHGPARLQRGGSYPSRLSLVLTTGVDLRGLRRAGSSLSLRA